MTLENLVIYRWQSAEQIAARARLNLVRRYQRQHERLDAEFDNIRVSHSWLADQDSEEAACLLVSYVETLGPYLRQRGLNGVLLQWCVEGLEAAAKLRRDLAPLVLLRSEAESALGRWDEALDSIQTAIAESQEVEPHTYARAVLALGRLQFNQGDYKTALDTLSRAETLLVELSDYEGVATVRAEFAAYHLNRKELDQALALYLEADELHRRAGGAGVSTHTLLMLGVVYRKKGNHEQAIAYLQQLFEHSEVQGNRGGMATATHHLAWVHFDQGNLVQAQRLCGRAIDLYNEIGDERGVSDAYEQLGCIALAQGNIAEAIPHLERALSARRQLGNQQGAASTLRHLAVAYFRWGRLVTASRFLWQSLVLYGRLGVLNRRRLLATLREFFGL